MVPVVPEAPAIPPLPIEPPKGYQKTIADINNQKKADRVEEQKANEENRNPRPVPTSGYLSEDATFDIEQMLIDTQNVCPLQRKELSARQLGKLQPNQFKNLLGKDFYNPSMMVAASCVTDAIIYGPVDNEYIGETQRIRRWLTQLKQIGAESVAGVALLANLDKASSAFVLKAPRNEKADRGLLHELFIGFFGTNPLRQSVPNFAYIFGGFKCLPPIVDPDTKQVASWCTGKGGGKNYVIYENIAPATSFREFVETCSAQEFLEMYIQILLALREAYLFKKFTHYDLHAENVLIRTIPSAEGKTLSIPYNMPFDKKYLLSNYIATIIDYGMSHIQHKDPSFGVIDFGYHGLEKYWIYSDRSHPLHDAYKLLLMSARAVTLSQHGNIPVYEEIKKIVQFFDNKDTLDDIVNTQSNNYYSLPLYMTADYKNSGVEHKGLDNLLKFIVSVCDCPFLTNEPNENIVSCQGATICVGAQGILRDIGIKEDGKITDIFDFYDAYIQGSNDPDVSQEDLERFAKSFSQTQGILEGQQKYAALIGEFEGLVNKWYARDLSIYGLPFKLILDANTARNYREWVTAVAKLYDLFLQIYLYHNILDSVGRILSEDLLEDEKDLFEDYGGYNTYREKTVELLGKFIYGIAKDNSYLQWLLNYSNDNYNNFYKASRADSNIAWYEEGLDSFRYMLDVLTNK